MVWGTDEQKRHFLPPIFRGDVRTWQLLTEPEAGSDLANVQTTAIRDGDEYVINGQKIYVGSTHGAEMSWMLVNTHPGGPRHRNLSWFMVPMHLPGVSWAPMDLLFAGNERGAASGHKQTVYFENVRLPAFNLIGGENNGWRVAGTHLELEHGLMQTSLRGDSLWERILRLYKTAKSDGTPYMDSPDAPTFSPTSTSTPKSVDSSTPATTGSSARAAPSPITAPKPTSTSSAPPSAPAKALHKLFGPYALTTDAEIGLEDGHIEVQQRGSIVAQHPGGTVEIQKVIMARRLGIGRAEPQKVRQAEVTRGPRPHPEPGNAPRRRPRVGRPRVFQSTPSSNSNLATTNWRRSLWQKTAAAGWPGILVPARNSAAKAAPSPTPPSSSKNLAAAPASGTCLLLDRYPWRPGPP